MLSCSEHLRGFLLAHARTRSVRIRSRAAGLFAAGYMAALTSFWIAGAAAYAASVHGLSRLLGLVYFPILLLPVLGRGSFGGLEIRSSIWLWWFALQMVLGVAAIWLYPYGRKRHRRPRRPRFEAARSGLPGDPSLARMPRS